MKNIVIIAVLVVSGLFIACEKSDRFNDLYMTTYELEAVYPGEFLAYDDEGYVQFFDRVDTLIRYYFYLRLSTIDSILFTESSSGAYYTHRSHFNISGDTMVYKSDFYYSVENNQCIISPVVRNSFFIIDANEENYLRALVLGEDDEEIEARNKRIYKYEDNVLIIDMYGVRIKQGTSTFEITVRQFDKDPVIDRLSMGEELHIMKYRLVYRKKD